MSISQLLESMPKPILFFDNLLSFETNLHLFPITDTRYHSFNLLLGRIHKMYYHTSQTGTIKILEPKIFNYNIPCIYFSSKRETVEKQGLIQIWKYEDLRQNMLSWIEISIKNKFQKAENELDYRYFLKAKFRFLSTT